MLKVSRVVTVSLINKLRIHDQALVAIFLPLVLAVHECQIHCMSRVVLQLNVNLKLAHTVPKSDNTCSSCPQVGSLVFYSFTHKQ